MQTVDQFEQLVLVPLYRFDLGLRGDGAIRTGAADVSRRQQDPTELHSPVVP
jgi:hypothetical protein